MFITNISKNFLRSDNMARLPKCASCVHSDLWGDACNIYPKGIPKDIATELVKCDKYELEVDTDIDESLPLAKGR